MEQAPTTAKFAGLSIARDMVKIARDILMIARVTLTIARDIPALLLIGSSLSSQLSIMSLHSGIPPAVSVLKLK